MSEEMLNSGKMETVGGRGQLGIPYSRKLSREKLS